CLTSSRPRRGRGATPPPRSRCSRPRWPTRRSGCRPASGCARCASAT
ncbi:MAG: hypothetical protein AVDCRST_MAG36-1725, partial [uncultured Nocardioidaceae bacterium]